MTQARERPWIDWLAELRDRVRAGDYEPVSMETAVGMLDFDRAERRLKWLLLATTEASGGGLMVLERTEAQAITVLDAAVAALGQLTAAWRRDAQPLIDRDDYSPESVDHLLRSWESLQTAAEGGTGGSYDSTGGGKHDRLALAATLADVEMATDRALADRLHWRCVQRIYARQGRPLGVERIGAFTRARYGTLRPEPGFLVAHWTCVAAIATVLGWRGYELAA